MNRSKLALLCGAPLTAICGAAFILSPSGFDDYDLAEGPDYAYRVAVDDEGYVYVASTCTNGNDDKDIVLLKYAPEIGSDPIWDVRYNGPGDGDDIATGIVIDSSGYIYVCGNSEGNGTGKDVVLLKIEPDGDPAWGNPARYSSGDSDDYATDMTLDTSGNLPICGRPKAACEDSSEPGPVHRRFWQCEIADKVL